MAVSLGAFSSQSWRISTPVHLFLKEHGSSNTIQRQNNSLNRGTCRLTCSKEGKLGEHDREANGHGFYVCTWNYKHEIFIKKTINDRVVIVPLEPKYKERNSTFGQEENALPLRECTLAHLFRPRKLLKLELLLHICAMSMKSWQTKTVILGQFPVYSGFRLSQHLLQLSARAATAVVLYIIKPKIKLIKRHFMAVLKKFIKWF